MYLYFLRTIKVQVQGQVSLIYELAWLAGTRKSEENCSKPHVRLLLWPKLPTYFDDVTTIENNQQVRVNIDATLFAIVRIVKSVGNFLPT